MSKKLRGTEAIVALKRRAQELTVELGPDHARVKLIRKDIANREAIVNREALVRRHY